MDKYKQSPPAEPVNLGYKDENKPSFVKARKTKRLRMRKSLKKVKRNLQANKVTTQFFPPQGEVATNLTLIVAVIIIFFCARAVLGTIAAPGGTIFALFILILLSLIAGQIVIQVASWISKLVGIDIKIPPLLGMMAVGITLKNVPYNFGQFGRAECIGNVSVEFADSLHNFEINSSEFNEELMGFTVKPSVRLHDIYGAKAQHSFDQTVSENQHISSSVDQREVFPLNDHEHIPSKADDTLSNVVQKSTPYQERLQGIIQNHIDTLTKISELHEELSKPTTPSDEDVIGSKHPKMNVLRSSKWPTDHNSEENILNLMDSRHKRTLRSEHAEESSSLPEDSCKKRFIGHELDPLLARTLRSICLTVILLMAGLELDPPALWRLKWIVLRTTFIPCLVEAFAASLFCYLILGFPFLPGLCFGFVLCGVSPAVIIPGLVNLGQRGFGVKKGIPTLVIATCSADDLVAIGGFGIALGITFNPDASITDLASHGPIEVIMGIGFGIFWGYVCQWLPSRHNKDYIFFRFIILFGGGLFALFGAHLIHYDGAGGLACVIMAFVASIQWRKEGWGDHNPITDIFGKMWIILAPVIFSLIGTNIQVDKMNGDTVGLGVAVLVCSFLTRSFFTFWSATFGGLNTKEKIFLSIAWLPKATVQAALGNNVIKPLILSKISLNLRKKSKRIFKHFFSILQRFKCSADSFQK